MGDDVEKEIALDDFAQQALAEYLDAQRTEAEAKARRLKARDILLDVFRLHDAEIGTVNDKPACRLVRSDREIVDTDRLRDEQPYTYARYRKMSTAYYVREIRGTS